MDENRVVVAHFQGEFADGFQEGQAFDVAGGAADFRDDHIRAALFGEHVDAVLDLIRHVRDHLDGLAQIFAFALVVEHGLVHLAAGQVVQAGEFHAGETFVMAQVQIGLGAVVEHIDFAVLVGRHRARVHVEVGVELLERDLESAVFQQRAQSRRREALAQGTYHAARYKYEFLHLKI